MSTRVRRVRDIYDHDPNAYHRAMSSGLTNRMLAGSRQKVGEMMPRAGRILEVGYGTGLSLPHYPSGVQVVGIDISRAMLAFGRRQAERDRRRAGLLVMDAERLGFPDHSFDAVAFNLCLCTIPDPDLAVAEALRVARPGAPMTFLEHVRSHLLPVALVQEALNPLLVLLQEDHLNRRTVEIVRRAGVEVERVDRWLLGVFNLIVGRAPV